ncbi:hypothetical protein CBS101457_004099 [Exobasidium rhododendri]|nr:hypothetical protein CBS101457_004099 [Exobasidium rhododendri]
MESEDWTGDGMGEIGQLLNDYTSLQAAHQSLLERCETQSTEANAEAQEEINKLRKRVKTLLDDLAKVTEEKDELSATVRDLRVRVEESRRAIMRLQGGGATASTATSAQNGTSGGNSTASGLANNPNRRSMGPSALSSWNPKEATASNGLTTLLEPASSSDSTYSHHSPEEAAELKKSKRASLAFGPNALGAIGRRAHGHRRIASGSRIGLSDEEGQTVNAPSQGLRELHLGGVTPTAVANTSKRSSFFGGNASLLSLSSNSADPSLEEGTSTLSIPSSANRRASNSSSLSGSAREELESGLVVPGSVGRSTYSPSSSTSMTSPIEEADERSRRFGQSNRSDEYDEPWTARASSSAAQSTTSGTFSAMQHQQNTDYHSHLQRQLAEQKFRVQDRDVRLNDLQREMQALRMELDDAKEARSASEACLKALKDFVKDEGGRSTDTDGGAQMLKGVKLPPLPTDKDTDDLSSDSVFVPTTPGRFAKTTDVITPTQATTSSTWKAFGTTFANLSRTKSEDTATKVAPGASEAINFSSNNSSNNNNTNDNNNNDNNNNNNNNNNYDIDGESAATSTSGTLPLSPSVQIGNSIGTLWSRATKRDSVSVVSSESIDSSGTPELKHSSMARTARGDAPNPTLGTSSVAPAVFKGFGWFNKRTTGDDTVVEATSPGVSTRVSSPPFANLDNHVLTLDQVQEGNLNGLGMANVPTSGSFTRDDVNSYSTVPSFEPNHRVRKVREKSGAVDEDTGFVPPTF